MRNSHPECPECGSIDVVPIVYGQPTKYMLEMEAAGLAVIGGHFSTDKDLDWHCNECEHEWSDNPEKARKPGTEYNGVPLLNH
jgi:hypothetical protein